MNVVFCCVKNTVLFMTISGLDTVLTNFVNGTERETDVFWLSVIATLNKVTCCVRGTFANNYISLI